MEVNAVLAVGDARNKVSDTVPVPVKIIDGVTVSTEGLDFRNLTAATDVVRVEPGTDDLKVTLDGELVEIDNTADLKVSLDGEAVVVDNTADHKVTLDGEQVSISETYTGGDAVPGGGPKGIVVMMVKGGYLVPVNDSGNDLPVATKATPTVIAATIADSESLSGEIDLAGASLLGIAMPAAWDAASLTFQASATAGGTYQEVYDDLGNPVTVAAAAGRMVAVDNAALKLAPWRYLKIRSGTAAVPVNQTAARAITLITK